MKKIYFIMWIFMLFHSNLSGMSCSSIGQGKSMKNSAKGEYYGQEPNIAKEINNVTQVIENEIKKIEDENTQLMVNIKELEKNQTISEIQRVFFLKQQNEVQSVINSINTEIEDE